MEWTEGIKPAVHKDLVCKQISPFFVAFLSSSLTLIYAHVEQKVKGKKGTLPCCLELTGYWVQLSSSIFSAYLSSVFQINFFPRTWGLLHSHTHTCKMIICSRCLVFRSKIFHSHLPLLSHLCLETAKLRSLLPLFKDVELQLKFIATFPSAYSDAQAG